MTVNLRHTDSPIPKQHFFFYAQLFHLNVSLGITQKEQRHLQSPHYNTNAQNSEYRALVYHYSFLFYNTSACAEKKKDIHFSYPSIIQQNPIIRYAQTPS